MRGVRRRSSPEIQRKAADGDLADAFDRLDSSEADAELIALAKDCLRREAKDRLRDAQVVTKRVTSYLTGVQERLRVSEIDRATATARGGRTQAAQLTVALASSILGILLLGGGGAAG